MYRAFEKAIVEAMRSIDWAKEGGAVNVIFLSSTEFQVFSEGNLPSNYEIPLDMPYGKIDLDKQKKNNALPWWTCMICYNQWQGTKKSDCAWCRERCFDRKRAGKVPRPKVKKS